MRKLIDWKGVLELWAGSCQSKKEFCEENKIPYTSFCKRVASIPKISLVPIRAVETEVTSPKLRNGMWTFEFPLEASPEYIGRVLRAVVIEHA